MAPQQDAWNELVDTRMAAALDNFTKVYSDQVVKLMFARMDKHKDEANAEIAKLKAEVRELRKALVSIKGNDRDLEFHTTIN